MGGGSPHGQVAHGFTLMIPPSGCFNTDVSRFLYCFSAPVPLVRHSRWHLCLGSPGTPRKRLPGRARGPEPRAETAGREDLFRGTPPCLPQIHQPQEGAGAPCPIPPCKRKEVGPRALKPDSALQGTESSETWARRRAGPHTGLGPSGWRPALETWLAGVRDSWEMGEGVHIPTPETAVRPGSGLFHAHPPGAGLLRKFGSTPAGRGGEGCRQARGSRQPGGTVCVSPLPPKRSYDRLAPPGRNQSSFPGPRGNFIYLPPNPWPHPHSGCRFWVSSLLKSLSFLQRSNQDSVER